MGRRFLWSVLIITGMAAAGWLSARSGLLWAAAVPAAGLIVWRPARGLLTSLEFSASLLGALAILTCVGTVVWGMPFFGQFWFMTLLGLMALSSFLCLVERLPTVKRLGYVLIHASIIVIIAGGTLRTFLKKEGVVGRFVPGANQVGLLVGQSSDRVEITDDGTFLERSEPLPFQVRLDDFRVDFYDTTPLLFVFVPEQDEPVARLDLNEGAVVTVAGTRIEAVGVRTRSSRPRPGHPELRTPVAVLRVDGREGAIGPDEPFGNDQVGVVFHEQRGEVKLYQSRLTLLDRDGNELVTQDVRVNEPLIHDGWWLYQSSWSPGNLRFSGIQAVHDPGIGVALAGLVLLVIGTLTKIRIPRRKKEDAA
ncbi:MAG: cytochrome c biogenesis protein ResB [Deltaproteobacteria bacterium]|nr:cytochrome c biogenesis protein ResB [Deltaproteobacteria bacterium]